MTKTELLPSKIATSLWLVPSTELHEAFLQQVTNQNRASNALEQSAIAGWLNQFTHQPQLHRQPQQPQVNVQTDQFSYVISFKGQWVGRLLMCSSNAAIHILDISLLPDYQNQGLGQAVINYLQHQAQSRQLPLTLQADETSRAYEWCLDCGFITTGKAGFTRSMAWNLPELVEHSPSAFAH